MKRLTTRPRWTTRSSSISHSNVTEGRTAIYPTTGSEFQNVRLILEFKALTPPIFRGGPNFLEAENWMKEIKKILDVMAVLEERRVSLASCWEMKQTIGGTWSRLLKMWLRWFGCNMRSFFYLITFQRPLEDKKKLNLYTWFKGIWQWLNMQQSSHKYLDMIRMWLQMNKCELNNSKRGWYWTLEHRLLPSCFVLTVRLWQRLLLWKGNGGSSKVEK